MNTIEARHLVLVLSFDLRKLCAGVYLVRVDVGEFTAVQKPVVQK